MTLGAAATGVARSVRAEPSHSSARALAVATPELTLHDLQLDTPAAKQRRRALVLVPAHGPRARSYPALLLLHGRGEVGDELIGIHAWRTRYGLADSYSRLRRPPLQLADDETKFMRSEQLDALNAQLAARPFEGMVMICPVTPNPAASAAPERVLDDYARWIEDALLPAARQVAALGPEAPIGIDGCSLGGYVAAEVFARKPHLFQTFGAVQPAIGQFRVARYAKALARARNELDLAGIHLLSSTRDPYRDATEAWGRELERLGARPTVQVLPGPHDQSWLRAAGTPTLLEWHHRHLTMRQH